MEPIFKGKGENYLEGDCWCMCRCYCQSPGFELNTNCNWDFGLGGYVMHNYPI